MEVRKVVVRTLITVRYVPEADIVFIVEFFPEENHLYM